VMTNREDDRRCAAPLFAERSAIEKKLGLLAVRIRHHRYRLSRAPRPVPMGQEMNHRLFGPNALVEEVTVLRKAGEIDDAEVRATRRPVRLVEFWSVAVPEKGRWLSDVVETRPHEFSEHLGQPLLRVELHIGHVGPRRG